MNAMEYIRRRIFGVTQTAMAQIAGVNQSTVCRWETGATYPSQGEMQRIRQAARRRGIPWNDTWFFEAPTEVAE